MQSYDNSDGLIWFGSQTMDITCIYLRWPVLSGTLAIHLSSRDRIFTSALIMEEYDLDIKREV